MPEHPTTWIGLIGVLLVVAGPIITTIISSRRIQKAQVLHDKRIGTEVGLLKDQVINGHANAASNLREDVDRVIHTGDQTHELLLDTHKMLTDHNSHIMRLGEKVNDHGNQIKDLSKNVADLHGKVNKVMPEQRKSSVDKPVETQHDSG